VSAAELEAETLRLAQRLAAGPTRAMGHTRRLLRRSFESSYAEQLDAEQAAFATCAESADFAEGIQAFFDKRPARFQGS
jgi:2-(1,2-epoxy-1,2-dihydrophenyl)acetyl-CoA isomerase